MRLLKFLATHTPEHTSNPCELDTLFGIPSWAKNLAVTQDSTGYCQVEFNGLNDVWLIALAVLEILMRLSAYAAVAFVIYGGIKFITSQGNPEKVAQARSTLANAAIGLIISILAITLVTFVAGSLD